MANTLRPLGLVTANTGGLSPLVSSEERVNFYCERNYASDPDKPSSRIEEAPTLYSTPGAEAYATLSDSRPRGLCVTDKFVFFVYGSVFARSPLDDLKSIEVIGSLDSHAGDVEISHNGVDIFLADGTKSYVYNGFVKPQPVVMIAARPPAAAVVSVTMKNQERRVIIECASQHFMQSGASVMFSSVDGFSSDDEYKIIGVPLQVFSESDTVFSVNAAISNAGDQINGSSCTYDTLKTPSYEILSATAYGDLLQIQTKDDHGLISGQKISTYGFSPSALNFTGVVARDSSTRFTLRFIKDKGEEVAVEKIGTYNVSGYSAFCYTQNPHGLMTGMSINITDKTAASAYSGDHIISRSGDYVFCIGSKTDNPEPSRFASYKITSYFTPVMSIGFLGAKSTAEVNGYVVNAIPNPDIPGQWQYSKPYAAGDYSALNFATCETFSDDLVCVREVGGNLAFLGAQSIEFWKIGTSADIPFDLVQDSTQNIGCVSSACASVIDDMLFFVGRNTSGEITAYVCEDMSVKQISTAGVGAVWGRYDDPKPLYAFTWHYRGHVFYQIEFKSATWVYDMTYQAWHRLTDADGGPVGFRAAFGSDLGTMFLSISNTKLFKSTPDSGTFDGKIIPRSVTMANMLSPNKVSVNAIQVIASCTGSGGSGSAALEISKDICETWSVVSPEKSMSPQAWLDDGAPRLLWNSIGIYNIFTLRFTVKSNMPVTVSGVWGNVTEMGETPGFK